MEGTVEKMTMSAMMMRMIKIKIKMTMWMMVVMMMILKEGTHEMGGTVQKIKENYTDNVGDDHDTDDDDDDGDEDDDGLMMMMMTMAKVICGIQFGVWSVSKLEQRKQLVSVLHLQPSCHHHHQPSHHHSVF